MSAQLEGHPAPTADVASERRWGRVAGACAALSVLATIGAVPVAATDVVKRVGSATDLTLLTSIGNSGTGQLLAMVLRVLSAALLVPVAVFMWRAVAARSERHSPWFVGVGLLAFFVIGVATTVGFFEVRDTARAFVASGPQTVPRAEDVLDQARGHGLLRAANIAQVVGGILFGIWVSLTSVEAGRVGLLTRFLAFFGIGAGIASAIGIPVGSALFLGWLGSIAVLMVGYWPGGRPLAWETGQAELPADVEGAPQVGRRGEEPVG